ncbi:2186_t:CDS:2 [Funneliformis caledonium]|uniref:2186_t:CDS:1 n=1 Tax=Funneliformis caledonium TaxID=1117310 RepID=A0A9N9GWS9_9GLOM|nr:2186_t:CDS:2 [Funneliformis caledonium]
MSGLAVNDFAPIKVLQPEAKKTKIIDLTEDNIDFEMEERRLLLRERQLEIEERELKLEREKLELQKLKHDFNITQ